MIEFDDAEIKRLRADTPGCAHVLHLNNAGASLPARLILDKQIAYLRREAETGGYEAAREAAEETQATYRAVADLLGCSPQEIALMPSATHAWNQAFRSINLRQGDRILTAEAEYAGNFLVFIQMARQQGIIVDVVPSDPTGQLDVARLEAMIDRTVKLIAVTHIPTNGGLVNPAEEIGKIARAHRIPFLLDACQSVGQIEVDVRRIGCDFLSSTGRKYLRGPRGTGFLYASRATIEAVEPPMIDPKGAVWRTRDSYQLNRDASRFETWEHNVAATLALGEAVRYALRLGMERIERRVERLGTRLRGILNETTGVTVCDQGRRRCGIVSFTIDGFAADDAVNALRRQQINVSVSRPEFTLIDMAKRKLPNLLRASVHYFNTEDELTTFGSVVERLIHAAR